MTLKQLLINPDVDKALAAIVDIALKNHLGGGATILPYVDLIRNGIQIIEDASSNQHETNNTNAAHTDQGMNEEVKQ